jgi:EAL domain-containing protein (putative c-di-GMP-specific phosphodiesterase class I)
MLDAFLAREVPLALDDIGAAGTLIALEVMAAVDYLKFDRAWLRRADDREALAMIKAMIGYAREAGKQTVMEGIESRADLEIAHGLGIDYAQGYLFRERFLRVEPAAAH